MRVRISTSVDGKIDRANRTVQDNFNVRQCIQLSIRIFFSEVHGTSFWYESDPPCLELVPKAHCLEKSS